MNNIRVAFFAASLIALFLSGCKKDTGTVQENITKVGVHLTGSGGFDQTFAWKDPDGGDISNAVVDDIVIPAGTANINCQLIILDETKTPVEDLTAEIAQESAAHLFVYTTTGTAVSAIAYDDVDSNGKNLGLKTLWATGTGTGTLRIVLHHQPTNKDDLNNPGGEIDFDVTFPVKIQ